MECYVCLEDGCQTLSPCKCTNLYLHEACYYELIEYNHTQCKVCKTDFPIVIEEKVATASVEVRPHKHNKLLCCLAYFSFFSIIYCIVSLVLDASLEINIFGILIAAGATLMLFFQIKRNTP